MRLFGDCGSLHITVAHSRDLENLYENDAPTRIVFGAQGRVTSHLRDYYKVIKMDDDEPAEW